MSEKKGGLNYLSFHTNKLANEKQKQKRIEKKRRKRYWQLTNQWNKNRKIGLLLSLLVAVEGSHRKTPSQSHLEKLFIVTKGERCRGGIN